MITRNRREAHIEDRGNDSGTKPRESGSELRVFKQGDPAVSLRYDVYAVDGRGKRTLVKSTASARDAWNCPESLNQAWAKTIVRVSGRTLSMSQLNELALQDHRFG